MHYLCQNVNKNYYSFVVVVIIFYSLFFNNSSYSLFLPFPSSNFLLEKTGRKRKKCPGNSPPGVSREGSEERQKGFTEILGVARVYGDMEAFEGFTG